MIAVLSFLAALILFYVGQQRSLKKQKLPREEVVLTEQDFWEQDLIVVDDVHKTITQELETSFNQRTPKANVEKARARRNAVKRRRKQRKLAKKSRQINRRLLKN